jgi:hypothetical protein
VAWYSTKRCSIANSFARVTKYFTRLLIVAYFTFLNFKKSYFILFLILFIGVVNNTYCQNKINKRTRLLFILDASSSMLEPWQIGNARAKAAAAVIYAIADSIYKINQEVEFGLRVFGAEYPAQDKMCGDTKLMVDFNLQNIDLLKRKLQYITNRGVSPIAYSLEKASKEELADNNLYDYSFIIVTDGGESCDGDICQTYQRLLKNKVSVSPYIIGISNSTSLKAYYDCIGQYVSVEEPNDIPKAVELILKNNKKLLDKPQTLNLPAKKSEITQPVLVPVLQDNLKPLSVIKFSNKKGALPANSMYTLNVWPLRIPSALAPIPLPTIVQLSTINTIKSSAKNTSNIKAPIINTIANTVVKIPEVMVPIQQGIVMMPIAKVVKKINNVAEYNLPQLISLSRLNVNLPKALIALEKGIEMVPLLHKSIPVVLPGFNNVYKLAEVANNKPSIPEAMVIKTMIPMDMLALKNVKPTASKTKLAEANPSVLSYLAPTTIPKQMIRLDIEPFEMRSIYVVQFRYGYQYVSAEVKPIAKKPLSIPEKFAKIPAPLTNTANEKPEFKLETKEASNTQLAIYFTDGFGKFYKNKPDISMVNSQTKQEVKRFERDVALNGEPIPVKLDIDGTFDISVLGQKEIRLDKVLIEKNKLNIITLKVTNGTLIFTYQNNRARPVNHKAVIVRRFAERKVDPVYMPATQQKMFEPGEYYIELDILPKFVVHTEISFGAITEVQVPQEGEMVINNTVDMGNVILYYQNGDTYEQFYTIKANGNAEGQQLLLKPGLYKASYKKPGAPSALPPTVISFKIASNKQTIFELKDYGANMVTPDAIGKPIYTNEDPTIKIISNNPTIDEKGNDKFEQKNKQQGGRR